MINGKITMQPNALTVLNFARYYRGGVSLRKIFGAKNRAF